MTRLMATVRNGQVILDDAVRLPEGTRIAVEIDDAAVQPATQKLTFGMLNPEREGPFSTEEDFKDARRSIWKDPPNE